MARGWESKAIEAQQQDRAMGGAKKAGREVTADERARAERRRTLELARARTLADLAAATVEGHRAMLQRALASIEDQLRDLS